MNRSSSTTRGARGWKFTFLGALSLLVLRGREGVRADEALVGVGLVPGLSAAQEQQVQDALRQHCLQRASAAEADAAVAAVTTFVGCLGELVDAEVLQREIEEAKPRGALDEVFKKYCDKSPQLKGCIGALAGALEPCLEEVQRSHVQTLTNVTDSLIDFVCYKDGDRIAMFIAEHGPECLQSKVDQLHDCVNNATHGGNYTTVVNDASTLPESCRTLDMLGECVVQQLEGCESPTSANMAESLFRFVRRSSPCRNQPQNKN